MGKGKYYVTSKHPNKTNYTKISPPPIDRPANKTITVGPGQCIHEINIDNPNQSDLNENGKYILSKDKGSKVRQFTKSPR